MATNQGGLNQVAAQGAGSGYAALTPEELDRLFGYNKDATVTYRDYIEDAENGDESGRRWADVTRAANLEDMFGKTDLSKLGYQRVAAGDSGLGAWINQKTGDVIVMGDTGKYGGGYSNTAYRTTLADFNKGLEGFGANWFRGYNPETGKFEGDKANGDPFADAMWGAMDYAPGLRKATSTVGAAAGDALERWGSGFVENVGEHFGDEFEKRGEKNADGDYKTSGEISYERGQEGRGGGVDRTAAQFSGLAGRGGGLGALFGAIGASGGANEDISQMGGNRYHSQRYGTFDDQLVGNMQKAAIGTMAAAAGQGASTAATEAGYGQYAGAAARLGSGTVTAIANDGDMKEVVKQALISYFTGMDPRIAQVWQAYQTANRWDSMTPAQRANAALSFYRQYGGGSENA
jgi:hypothetical protein